VETVTRPQNKHLKPFPKGHKHIGPGRPKTRAFVAYVKARFEDNPSPAEMKKLVDTMLKKCPQEIAHYLAGKPLEQMRIEMETTNKFSQEDIELAAAVSAKRRAEAQANAKMPQNDQNKDAGTVS
jgi:hypothetical protein